ncbi:MAG: hypothetical protein PUJ32_00005 [Lactobacillus johnsonii]|nr:hypothetical protein [Lactobacillus johnsonii]
MDAYLAADPTAVDAKLVKGMLVITYKDTEGTLQSREISREAGQSYVQAANGVDAFLDDFEPIADRLYSKYGVELGSAILDYLAGTLDINELDAETAEKLRSLGPEVFKAILNNIDIPEGEQDLPELGEWNEAYHNRIKYLGSDLGGALNERDNLIGKYQEIVNSEEYEVALNAKLRTPDQEQLLDEVNSLVKSLSENADAIKLSISSSLREDVDEAFDIAKSFDTLQDKIANGLEMTTDEVVDLIDSGYGALLQNCEATSEGLISLNQNVVDAYVA